MVIPGEKHLERFGWGDAEQFHTLEDGANKYWLFDSVTIDTADGRRANGQIVFIDGSAVHIMPDDRPVKIINLKDIKNIKRISCY